MSVLERDVKLTNMTTCSNVELKHSFTKTDPEREDGGQLSVNFLNLQWRPKRECECEL